MNKMVQKKKPEGADIAGGMALMVAGIATRAAPLIILGALLMGKGAAALKKKAAGGDQRPLSKGFVPVPTTKTLDLEKAWKNPARKMKLDVKTPQHSHMIDVSGQFDPVTGYYALPEVVPCICPKCGATTDTSRRFCNKCDTDLRKAHGG